MHRSALFCSLLSVGLVINIWRCSLIPFKHVCVYDVCSLILTEPRTNMIKNTSHLRRSMYLKLVSPSMRTPSQIPPSKWHEMILITTLRWCGASIYGHIHDLNEPHQVLKSYFICLCVWNFMYIHCLMLRRRLKYTRHWWSKYNIHRVFASKGIYAAYLNLDL